MSRPEITRLLALLQATVTGTSPDAELFVGISDAEWEALYRRAAYDGVLAVAFDSVMRLPAALHPPKKLALTWAASVDRIEQNYGRKVAIANELAARFGEHGIRMLIIKGLSIAQYHPVPAHREFGDLDIYLFDRQQDGDRLLVEWGASVEDLHSTKHTNFIYKGIPVENHIRLIEYCNEPAQLPRDNSRLNDLAEAGLGNAVVGHPLFPSPDFTLVFFLYHALVHFMVERLRWRYFCDWALFLRSNKGRWSQAPYDMMFPVGSDIRKAADAFNAIVVARLGLPAADAPHFERNAAIENVILEEMDSPAEIYVRPKTPWGIIAWKYRRFAGTRRKVNLIFPGTFNRSVAKSIVAHLRYPGTIFALPK
ncbi:MAG: nucleotidyltransferase family protein [Bacteroidales bacterium]|jgi:hypothetical protein|nr:nucleotidyltransferase family protein [Bacteroidales bacterium]